MQRSTFKVLFYVKRQSENRVRFPSWAALRSTVRCRSSVANSPFVLLFGMPRRTKPPAKASNRSASTRNWKISRPISTSSINASATVCYGRKGMQFRVKLFPVAEMIYDRYKDLHLEGNKVFPIKRYYKTMNMSLRHVTNMRHTFARRLRLRRAYPWKPSARCWDINGSPRPKSMLKSPMTRSGRIWRH